MLLLLIFAGGGLVAGLRPGWVPASPSSRPLKVALPALDACEKIQRLALVHRGHQPSLPDDEVGRLLAGARQLLLDSASSDPDPATLLWSLSALHLSVELEDVRGVAGLVMAQLSSDPALAPQSLSLALQAAARIGMRNNRQLAPLLQALPLALPRLDATPLAQSIWALGAYPIFRSCAAHSSREDARALESDPAQGQEGAQ